MKQLTQISILWVEDDPDDYVLIGAALAAVQHTTFDITWVTSYEAALVALARGSFEVCLVDYQLGAHNGLELLREIVALGCDLPVILLTGQGDHAIDLEAMQAGAADYLVKRQITASPLERAIRYTIERHRLLSALRDLSLRDDLTGLYNRRGFIEIAEQQCKLMRRQGHSAVVVLVDLDRLKWINDTFGHATGSKAITDTAHILRATFRSADILCRFGGDEFVVLALNCAASDIESIQKRLADTIQQHNSQPGRSYALSLSVGIAHFNPANEALIESALVRADQEMYAQKRARAVERGL